jgi:hypothetical protein
LRTAAEDADTEAQRALSECAAEWAERNVSAREIEESIMSISGSSYLAGSYSSCRGEFEALFFHAGETGAADQQIACFVSALKAALEDSDRQRLFEALVSGQPIPAGIAAKRDDAAARCMTGPGSSSAAPA